MQALIDAITAQIDNAQVYIDGDACGLQATVISNQFNGQLTLARQKMVMRAAQPLISDGTVHALSLRTYTPEEWHALHGK